MKACVSHVSSTLAVVRSSVGFVADLMREMGLKAVQPRTYRVTTVHGFDDEYPADGLEREFNCGIPGTNTSISPRA